MTESLICSAKGCAAQAQHAIEWNNPKIHTPERIKVWLACNDHEDHLREFLTKRGFYRSTKDVAALSKD